MRQTVEQWIENRRLIKPGSRILVAVSGGPDSMAVLHILKEMEASWDLVVMAAHVNHGLRKKTADRDEEFVRRWCKEMNVPFFSAYVSVDHEIKDKGGSVQEQARHLRYDYLSRVMKQKGIQTLVTGHHGDDQIETMIMKQLSGRAVLGEQAIKAKRSFAAGMLIRPLLGVTKEEILEYCSTKGIPFQKDESNDSDKYTRNRIRHHVLPSLKSEDPHAHKHFQQYADWLQEERAYIQEQAEQEWGRRIIRQNEHSVTIYIKGMEALPLPLQRRGIHLVLKYLCSYHVPELSVVHIEQFLELLRRNHPSAILDWPGNILVRRDYDEVTFSIDRPRDAGRKRAPVDLSVPGEAEFGRFLFETAFLHSDELSAEQADVLAVDAQEAALPLTVRSPQPGDRLQPLGMKGSKKVNRIFIDEKVSRDERWGWPVVVDAHGTVIWLPLLKKSSRHVRSKHSGAHPLAVVMCRDTSSST